MSSGADPAGTAGGAPEAPLAAPDDEPQAPPLLPPGIAPPPEQHTAAELPGTLGDPASPPPAAALPPEPAPRAPSPVSSPPVPDAHKLAFGKGPAAAATSSSTAAESQQPGGPAATTPSRAGSSLVGHAKSPELSRPSGGSKVRLPVWTNQPRDT